MRQILQQSLLRERGLEGLGSRIAQRFAAVGGVDLPQVVRTMPRPSPEISTDDPL